MSNLLSIAFGVISTIATLIGLIAIFLSLNMQHNIQKLRDIFWGMSRYSRYINKHLDIDSETHFNEQFILYEQIYNNGSKLTKRTLSTALLSLVIMALIFILVLYIIMPPSSNFLEFIIAIFLIISAITALFLFFRLLWISNSTKKISDLPSPQEILNGKPKGNINTLVIAGQFMKLHIIRWDNNDSYQFLVGLPLPFTDIEVSNELFMGMNNPNLDDDYFTNIIHLSNRVIDGRINLSSTYSPYSEFNEYYWFNLSTGIKLDRSRDYLRVELSLTSAANRDEVSVYYDYIKISDLFESSLSTVIVAPTHIEITNGNTRLKGPNITKEMLLELF
ncbi:hypothetical protein [Paenibacillus peoriae]|uniref:hypothetical protein n=1 Tax=Paenibacillus peoriae TaxID=59893 RepID=UPI00118087F3|nr:hypothetical protein [Paenibacillus peoriae]